MTGGNTRIRRDSARIERPVSARPVPVSGSRTFAPASWALVIIALLLIGVLTYYLTLTTRPEISSISPPPNSSQAPGLVSVEVMVNSQRGIDSATLTVDEETVSPSIEQIEDSTWRVAYEEVFERGDRELSLQVIDESGRAAEHTWNFASGGDLIQPRLSLSAPPSDVRVEPGPNGVVVRATTFADIDEATITFDGEPTNSQITQIEAATEYADEGVPVYEWEIRAETRLESGDTEVGIEVIDEFGAVAERTWTMAVAVGSNTASARYFSQTHHYIAEPFLSFWDENDGETTIGPPVGPAFAEENGAQQQYFRYARLELNDEGDVQRGLIGREIFGDPENPPDRSPGSGAREFDATGHYIIGTIQDFWDDNGGLNTFGYPISQEFETDSGYAQYFERALIEVIVLGSYELVEIAPLGRQMYESLRHEGDPARQSADDS
ncbi:MAG: hypothetical protein EA415_13140 [Sphaerobacteraceae bacterium]|nr:MAG: hypothetical protein EA415_13140 [Sphaerobacteraceae bacterium]